MFTGLPCWSSHLSSRSGHTHTHQHSLGCHCPVTSNQQHEPLLTFSLATSTIFFILKYAPLAMPKVSYPSMEFILIPILRYIKTSFSACTSTDLNEVHFSSWNCTPVLFPRIQFCFSITQFENSNCIIDWNVSSSNLTSQPQPAHRLDDVNFNHLSERTLCATPHIGCQFMSWYFNVRALGIANYKWETVNFGL